MCLVQVSEDLTAAADGLALDKWALVWLTVTESKFPLHCCLTDMLGWRWGRGWW